MDLYDPVPFSILDVAVHSHGMALNVLRRLIGELRLVLTCGIRVIFFCMPIYLHDNVGLTFLFDITDKLYETYHDLGMRI